MEVNKMCEFDGSNQHAQKVTIALHMHQCDIIIIVCNLCPIVIEA
jgi:hypothetical protein